MYFRPLRVFFPMSVIVATAAILIAILRKALTGHWIADTEVILAVTSLMVLVIGLLACASWILSEQRWQRYTGAVIFAAGFYALLLTFSRAAWGALVIGILLALPLAFRHMRRPEVRRSLVTAVGLTLVAGLVFFISYRPFLAARVGEGQESIELRSVSDRIVFTQFALQSIGERPVLGVGIGNFPWRTSYYLVNTFYQLRGDYVHNIYLAAWTEMGTIGLLLYLAAMLFGVIAGVKAIRFSHLPYSPPRGEWETSRASRGEGERISLLAIFFALAAAGLLDHYPYSTIHFQVALWGCLAAALRPNAPAVADTVGKSVS